MIEMHKGACLFSSYVSKVDIFPEYIHLTFLYSLTCHQQRAYADSSNLKHLPNHFYLQEAWAISMYYFWFFNC